MTVDSVEEYFYNKVMRQYFGEGRLYSLQLEINTACGQACRFCYVRRTVPSGTQLPKEFVLSVLEQVAEIGVRTIEWLGGDPLRHPDIWEFVATAESLGLVNNIWSTGDLLTDPKTVDFLLAEDTPGMVSFHLDTLDPQVYQHLSSSPASHINKVMSDIEYLMNIGVRPERLYNCMTFTRLQAGEDFKNTVRTLFERFGIFSGIVPYKHVVDDPTIADLVPSPQQIYEALSFRSSLMYGGELPVIPNCVSKFYCGTTCALTVNRELTPCARIRYAVDRVTENDFLTPFRVSRSRLLKEPLRDSENISGQCRGCKYTSICWGCRGNAWYYGGDFLGEDPKCWHGVHKTASHMIA